MSEYERAVRSVLSQTVLCLLLALASMSIALLSIATLSGNALKVGLMVCGAGMAIFGLIAQHRYGHFNALLTPNTFVSGEFIEVFQKYKRYQTSHGQALLVIAIAGALLGLYASLSF